MLCCNVLGFSGSLTAVINHGWHLLLHINVLKFHRWVPHSDWCRRFSPYPPRHSPAEYEMNRRSSPRLTVTPSCINVAFSQWDLMTGSDKPVYVFTPNALLFLQSFPALAALTVFCLFCDALLLSHYIVCSSWENTFFFFLHPFSQST